MSHLSGAQASKRNGSINKTSLDELEAAIVPDPQPLPFKGARLLEVQ